MKVSIYPTENGYYAGSFDAHSEAETSVREESGRYFVDYTIMTSIASREIPHKKSFPCEDAKNFVDAKLEALEILKRNVSGMVDDISDLEFIIK